MDNSQQSTDNGQRATVNGRPTTDNGRQANGTLIVLLGPTAVGKTELSLRLAKLLSCPIISADSRQIYRDIPIGTAAPTADELAAVKHFFIHQLALGEYYSAAQYEADVMQLLRTEPTRGEGWGGTPDAPFALLTGGSMMYIDAVCNGIDDIPTISPAIRATMRQRLQVEGLDALVAELQRLDPEYYAVVDRKNPKRIVHALEICHQSGQTFTSLRKNERKPRPFRIVKIGLQRPREQLFERINRRVDQMMSDGLLDEVRRVYPLRNLNSLNTVGYKELFNVLSGEWELPMAVERIKKNTRVYAKKQMTWFQRDPSIHWVSLDQPDAFSEILSILRQQA